jgi:hypothetical protein
MGLEKRKGERVLKGPVGDVRIPVGMKTRPSREEGVPASRKMMDQTLGEGLSQAENTVLSLIKCELKGWGPKRRASKE